MISGPMPSPSSTNRLISPFARAAFIAASLFPLLSPALLSHRGISVRLFSQASRRLADAIAWPKLCRNGIGENGRIVELKELRNFMHVARAGSVSRAAEELRLAQPALSRQIKKLEHELGVSLFARHGRGVRLSAAGSLLLERAEAIAHLVHQTCEEIKDDRSPRGGRIALGVPPAAGRILIPHFAARFQETWPQATLHMREGVASSLQEWLVEKRIDIAMLHNPPHLEALDISPLLTERMWVIGPPARRGKGRQPRASFRVRDLGSCR